MRFLLESLEDLNTSFATKYGGFLHLFTGKPVDVFAALSKRFKIEKICFEQVNAIYIIILVKYQTHYQFHSRKVYMVTVRSILIIYISMCIEYHQNS